MKRYLLLIAIGLGFAGCADQNGNLTSHFTGRISNVTRGAIQASATAIVDAAVVYQKIGEPGLPDQNKPIYNGLTSAVVQLQAQVGTAADVTAISTGTPAVDAALAKTITPGAVVQQSDVDKLQAAAASVPKSGVPASDGQP